MAAQQFKFANYAQHLLQKNNNKLPKRNECSDTRSPFLYKYTQKPRLKKFCTKFQSLCKTRKMVQKHCPVTCNVLRTYRNSKNRHRDATLAKFAILNF